MERTITIKGVGNVSARPDYIIIGLTLEAQSKSYDTAMDTASENIAEITECICKLGFKKEDLKTTNFDVSTDYKSVKDKDGNYQSVFNGYTVTHNLKFSFDFDSKILAKVLSAIATTKASPEFNISFTVKDTSKISKDLLCSATKNAKEKAEILCDASGVALGKLISIDYNWARLDVFSHTRYSRMEEPMLMARAIDIEPEDIKLSDSATFIWEIV